MATETGTDWETGSDEAVLIELEVGRVGRVDRPSSPWTALLIALFTALTCLGLGATVLLPGPVESAPSQVPERAGQPGTSLPATPSVSVASADRRHPPAGVAVEASARIVTVANGSRVVRIAGQAAVTVRSLDVTLILAARTAAGAKVAIASEATLIAAIGPSGVGAAPWSVDFTLPMRATAGTLDAVATVQVGWPASPAGPAGALDLVVNLGDGRGH